MSCQHETLTAGPYFHCASCGRPRPDPGLLDPGRSELDERSRDGCALIFVGLVGAGRDRRPDSVARMTLKEFLLDRIAEDEEFAKGCEDEWEWRDSGTPADPARVLAECEAKRRIVESLAAVDVAPSEFLRGWDTAAYFNVLSLAQVYADHPDYDESWGL